jgi:hypothetical protein
LAYRLHSLLAGSAVTVEFAPGTEAEILAAIAEGLTPIDVARIRLQILCDPVVATRLAELLELGQQRR